MARPVPLGLAVIVVVVAVGARRPALVCVGGLLLASSLGARAQAGMQPPEPGPFQGAVTLVSDPDDRFGTTTAIVRVSGKRLELSAAERGRGALRTRLAGERVHVDGRVRPPPDDAPWLVVRHVVGRLEARSVEPVDGGAAPWRAANRVRRLLVAGSASLPPDRRSLFTGFVLGDDRDQPATLADDFTGAGLTHLLAVSGENVAFVLALAGPGLRRLRLGPRWAATVAVIAFFALVTRFEPSVLRAGTMAALAATAFAVGRPASGLRLLALAAAGLVLIDPLLIGSVGFQLSVAASGGILVLGPSLRRAIPGPAGITDALAVTGAAQLGVAPVLVATFGGLPVASLPANLMAGPAAGLVMMWGLGAGLVAGLVGGRPAALLHLPTSLFIGWIETVARVASSLPLGELDGAGVAAVAVGLVMLVVGSRVQWRPMVAGGTAVVVLALLAPAADLRRPPLEAQPAPGASLWRAGGATVVVLEGASPGGPERLLEGLRRAGVRRIDLVVAAAGGPADASAVAALRHRWVIGDVWAPPGNEVYPGRTLTAGTRLQVGGLDVTVDVTVDEDGPRLAATVARAGAAATASRGQRNGEDPGVGSPRAARARAPPLRRDPPGRRHGDPEPHP
jgi:competence protein ComEC